jgi:arginase
MPLWATVEFELVFDPRRSQASRILIDLDGLDPAFAPGVSHRESGGLSAREVLGLVQGAAGPLVGADVVEFNPARDPQGITASLAAKLVKELAARMLADV